MIHFRENFAVIVTVHHNMQERNTHISAADVRKMSDDLEESTGQAVINGFTDESLNSFFRSHSEYFRPTGTFVSETDQVFEIRTDPHEDVVRGMIWRFDPALNYPLDFLRATGLLPVLGIDE